MATYTFDKIEYGGNTYVVSDSGALQLTGGQVTGPVTFGDSVSIDEATLGDLVVNGSASFTNNIQANTINGVTVGSSPKFTDTVTTVTTSGSGNAVTAISASNGAITVTKGSTFLTGITSSQVTTALGYTPYNSTNPNGYTTNTGTVTKVTAGTGLSIGTTAGGNFTTSGTINHTNSVTAQTTQAVYPIKIDAQGHISAYGNAVTIPTIPSNNVTGSGSNNYLAKWSGTNTLSSTSLSISTSYNNNSDSYGTIKLYVGSTGQVDWKGQLVFHDGSSSKTITITPPSLTASRTLTLPDKTGTIALTSDLPTVPSNIVNTITTTAGAHTAITSQKGNVSFNVPTKTSHLTNDSGFITNAGVTSITTTAGAHTAITSATGAVSFKVPTTAAHVGAATSDHTHGNITNGGDITATAPTIASGDQIVINDNSASKITNGPTFDGSTTTTALTPKGTWESFAKSDTNTTYALSGALSSHKFTSTLTAGGSGSGTSTSDFTLAAGTGITITDDTSNRKMTIACSVTNTDTKVSTAAITSGTTYYPTLGSDTTSAATKFYDKTGIKYSAVPGAPYDYSTGDAMLTLGNDIGIASNGYKRGVLRLYSRYENYTNLVTDVTGYNNEVQLPVGSGTLALQTELPSISYIRVTEDVSLPGTYNSADLSNFSPQANMNYLFLELIDTSNTDLYDFYVLTDYYVEPIVANDYNYEIWWFTGVFKKTGDNQKKITVGIYLDETETEHAYGEVTVNIDEKAFFYVNSLTSVTISSTNTPIKLPINGMSSGVGFTYDSTNKGIVCHKTSRYAISAQIGLDTATSGDLIGLHIYKDGTSIIGPSYHRVGGNYDCALLLPTIITMEKDSVYTVYIHNNTNSRGKTSTGVRISCWEVQ